MTNRTVLLTGATGIMGSWVLGEALARGYEPIVLMRDPNHDHAMARLAIVLDHVGQIDQIDRVRVYLGDAREPMLGLGENEREEVLGALGGMIHCAACTSFEPERDDEIWQTNVHGVEHVLAFLEGAGVPLYHVSTAYVAGRRRGLSFEGQLDSGQEFNNTYERSKCYSEALVRSAFDSGRLMGSIFRPSIITGASRDGRILQFMNFYNVLRMMDLIQKRRTVGPERFRVQASLSGTKNIVPVDWTAKALWHIIEAEGPAGQVYHLTNPEPLRHDDLQVWCNGLLLESQKAFELVPAIEGEMTSLEALIERSFRNYRPYYLCDEPQFDRANTDRALDGSHPFPALTPGYFQILVDYARSARWKSLFEARNPRAMGVSPFTGMRAPEAAPARAAG